LQGLIADIIYSDTSTPTLKAIAFVRGRPVEESLHSLAKEAATQAATQFNGMYPEGVPGAEALESLVDILTKNLEEGLERSWIERMPATGEALKATATHHASGTTAGVAVATIELLVDFGEEVTIHSPWTAEPTTLLIPHKRTFKVRTTAEHSTWNGLGRYEAETTYTGADTETGLESEMTFSDLEHDTYPLGQ
jgi:hypothetical protein